MNASTGVSAHQCAAAGEVRRLPAQLSPSIWSGLRDILIIAGHANSIDAVSDRDYLIEFNAAAAIFMMHVSRKAEEQILCRPASFAFIEISDAFCSGSSIMPQKKNPDVPELMRGKTARVYGNLTALYTDQSAASRL